jgi:hypothetical protein
MENKIISSEAGGKIRIPCRSIILARHHVNDCDEHFSLEDCMLSSNLLASDRSATATVEMTRTRTGGMNREDEERLSWDFPSFSEDGCSSRLWSEIDQNRLLAVRWVRNTDNFVLGEQVVTCL